MPFTHHLILLVFLFFYDTSQTVKPKKQGSASPANTAQLLCRSRVAFLDLEPPLTQKSLIGTGHRLFHRGISGWPSTWAESLSSLLLSYFARLPSLSQSTAGLWPGWGVDALRTTPTVYDVHNGFDAVWWFPRTLTMCVLRLQHLTDRWKLTELLPRFNPPSLQCTSLDNRSRVQIDEH